jgi:hypothetical protein
MNLAGIQNRLAGYPLKATWMNPDQKETKDSSDEMFMGARSLMTKVHILQ